MAIIALNSAASGLKALSTQLDVISNNIANANNNGFKASRVNFEDLLYQYHQVPGGQNGQGDVTPLGVAIGLGTRVTGTQLDLAQGSSVTTGREFDLQIDGDGFFRVKTLANQGDGLAYTRTGSFTTDADGNLVMANSSGYKIDPPIQIPQNTTKLAVSQDGRVSAIVAGQPTAQDLGQLQIATFRNPQGLIQIGQNLYQRSDASGADTLGKPGDQGFGQIRQGMLETSNVDPVKELVDLIKTQRTFEMNSQSIQAADQMLQGIANLRR